MLTFGLMALLAVEPAAELHSPYLDAVRQYGPGAEQDAVAALLALKLDDPDLVVSELETRVCSTCRAAAA